MMSISANLMRVPVDGTDPQARGGQDGSLPDGAPKGFDDVLTQVNGPATPAAGGAAMPGPPAGSRGFGTQGGGDGQTAAPGFPMRTIGSLADLISQLTTNATANGASDTTPSVPVQSQASASPDTLAGALPPLPSAGLPAGLRPAPWPAGPAQRSASGSTLEPGTGLQAPPTGVASAAALAGPVDESAASPAKQPQAIVMPLAPGSVGGGQAAQGDVAAAALALVSSAVAMSVDVKPGSPKVGTIGASPTSAAKSPAKPSAAATTIDPAIATDASAAMTAGAILAALLGMPSPVVAPHATSAAPIPSKTPTGATAPMQAPETADGMADAPLAPGDVEPSSDGGNLAAMPSTNVDAQIASRAPDAGRTSVSVVGQATFFPTVSGLSVVQQLADPIVDAARATSDVQAAAPTVETAIGPASANAPIRTLDVTLSPGNLGSVTISMKLVDGSLHLGVAAQDAGTAHLIERDKGALAGALHASGYAVADLNIVHAAGAGAQTQSGGSHAGASQDQRNASSGQAGSSEQGGSNGGGSDDRSFTRGRARPEDAGSGSGATDRSDGSVFL